MFWNTWFIWGVSKPQSFCPQFSFILRITSPRFLDNQNIFMQIFVWSMKTSQFVWCTQWPWRTSKRSNVFTNQCVVLCFIFFFSFFWTNGHGLCQFHWKRRNFTSRGNRPKLLYIYKRAVKNARSLAPAATQTEISDFILAGIEGMEDSWWLNTLAFLYSQASQRMSITKDRTPLRGMSGSVVTLDHQCSTDSCWGHSSGWRCLRPV
jgi:hypothetical protein